MRTTRIGKTIATVALAAVAFGGASCFGDESGDDPNDGGDQTAETGPTTPDQTALQTGTPEAPTGDETDFMRTEETGDLTQAPTGATDGDPGEAESEP